MRDTKCAGGGRTKATGRLLTAGTWDEIRRITATDKQVPDGYPEPSWSGMDPVHRDIIEKDIIETFIHG